MGLLRVVADGEAVSWLTKADEGSEAGAQYSLGCRFLEGKGVRKDEKEALKWLKKGLRFFSHWRIQLES